jgi:hypothetical protein
MPRVKRTIYLNAELDRKLTAFAAARGISKAEAIRRAVEREVAGMRRPRISALGVFEGPGDLSENDERYLAQTGFGED